MVVGTIPSCECIDSKDGRNRRVRNTYGPPDSTGRCGLASGGQWLAPSPWPGRYSTCPTASCVCGVGTRSKALGCSLRGFGAKCFAVPRHSVRQIAGRKLAGSVASGHGASAAGKTRGLRMGTVVDQRRSSIRTRSCSGLDPCASVTRSSGQFDCREWSFAGFAADAQVRGADGRCDSRTHAESATGGVRRCFRRGSCNAAPVGACVVQVSHGCRAESSAHRVREFVVPGRRARTCDRCFLPRLGDLPRPLLERGH